jgi:hypothetical protein
MELRLLTQPTELHPSSYALGLCALLGKKIPGAAHDHERRLQRLQEILDELRALSDWKKL